MHKKITTILCVIMLLTGILLAGCSSFKSFENEKEQAIILTEQKEIEQDVKLTEQNDNNLKQNIVEAEKEEIVDEPEKTVIQEEATIPNERLVCTLSVNCYSVIENIEKLKDNKKDFIPTDGIILKETEIEFFPDETVFDILCRELKNNNIHFEFVKTPAYNSVYIEGIANLYEFDCGELSGWLYKVNGVKPTFGCSQYRIENNDRIEFFYSCDMFE